MLAYLRQNLFHDYTTFGDACQDTLSPPYGTLTNCLGYALLFCYKRKSDGSIWCFIQLLYVIQYQLSQIALHSLYSFLPFLYSNFTPSMQSKTSLPHNCNKHCPIFPYRKHQVFRSTKSNILLYLNDLLQ